jgi:hypothetical protein
MKYTVRILKNCFLHDRKATIGNQYHGFALDGGRSSYNVAFLVIWLVNTDAKHGMRDLASQQMLAGQFQPAWFLTPVKATSTRSRNTVDTV